MSIPYFLVHAIDGLGGGGYRRIHTYMYIRRTQLTVYDHHSKQSMDQPGKIANPARGQLNRKCVFSLSPFALENLVS